MTKKLEPAIKALRARFRETSKMADKVQAKLAADRAEWRKFVRGRRWTKAQRAAMAERVISPMIINRIRVS